MFRLVWPRVGTGDGGLVTAVMNIWIAEKAGD